MEHNSKLMMGERAPLWTPSAAYAKASNMERFRLFAESRAGHPLPQYEDIHKWSVSDLDSFWLAIWDFFKPIADYEEHSGPAYIPPAEGSVASQTLEAQWFPGVNLNYAENLLKLDVDSGAPAIISLREDGSRFELSRSELIEKVTSLSRSMQKMGVGPGDRVAAVVSNGPEAIIAMLATTAIGAVWSSCAPEFGAIGILDRFTQVNPKILIGIDAYHYKGKVIDVIDRMQQVAQALPDLEQVIIIPYNNEIKKLPSEKNWRYFEDAIKAGKSKEEFIFERFSFDHPIFIMFSSGTTGLPKCIVHRAGGILLQQLKETALQYDVKAGDRYFYYTSWAWNMWVWLVTPLALGATVLQFDGMPMYPNMDAMFNFVDAEGITHFGTSPKYLETIRKSGLCPKKTNSLSTIKVILSTGSPLSADTFCYIQNSIKSDVPIISLSGGTEVNATFATGNPLGPVWAGELQAKALGMNVDVYNEHGKSVGIGKPGELVCKSPFPSQPLGFLNDEDGSAYKAAYFDHFSGVWTHGDWCEITANNGMIIHGRSDSVLKPSGVRIGTAEIYRPLESLLEITDAVVVGFDCDGDQRLVLFVVLAEGELLDINLEKNIRNTIREAETPRHVPWKIYSVQAIPRTHTGKIAEKAVREAIHGRLSSNSKSLEDPSVLGRFLELGKVLALEANA